MSYLHDLPACRNAHNGGGGYGNAGCILPVNIEFEKGICDGCASGKGHIAEMKRGAPHLVDRRGDPDDLSIDFIKVTPLIPPPPIFIRQPGLEFVMLDIVARIDKGIRLQGLRLEQKQTIIGRHFERRAHESPIVDGTIAHFGGDIAAPNPLKRALQMDGLGR